MIAMLIGAKHPRNLAWARQHRLKYIPRWIIRTVEVRESRVCHGDHPVLSQQLFRSYREAITAIESWSHLNA